MKIERLEQNLLQLRSGNRWRAPAALLLGSPATVPRGPGPWLLCTEQFTVSWFYHRPHADFAIKHRLQTQGWTLSWCRVEQSLSPGDTVVMVRSSWHRCPGGRSADVSTPHGHGLLGVSPCSPSQVLYVPCHSVMAAGTVVLVDIATVLFIIILELTCSASMIEKQTVSQPQARPSGGRSVLAQDSRSLRCSWGHSVMT